MPIFLYSAQRTEAFIMIRKTFKINNRKRQSLQFARWDLVNDKVVFDSKIRTNFTNLRLFGCSLRQDGKEMLVSLADHSRGDYYFSLKVDTETFHTTYINYWYNEDDIPPYYVNGRYTFPFDAYYSTTVADECYLQLTTTSGRPYVNNYHFQRNTMFRDNTFYDQIRHRTILVDTKYPFTIFEETGANTRKVVHALDQVAGCPTEEV